MEAQYDQLQTYIQQLSDDKAKSERRLANAGKLISLLGEEGERWLQTVGVQEREVEKLLGNVFLAAASISYIGPFTVRLLFQLNIYLQGAYREKLIESWSKMCHDEGIPISERYSLVGTLGDPVQIRDWNLCSLPSDAVSIDNGILATNSKYS